MEPKYFLYAGGSVRILLPLKGGRRHHLATISSGDFFGELSFLDRTVCSADAEAKVTTCLYVLSRSNLDKQSRADASFGVRFFARLSLTIAKRLRQDRRGNETARGTLAVIPISMNSRKLFVTL